MSKFLIPILLLIAGALLFLPQQSKPVQGCGPFDGKPISEGYDPTATVGQFEGRLVKVPPLDPPTELAQVLGDTAGKRLEVDLTGQRVYAYEGNNRIGEYVVSTGLGDRTPRGDFTIQKKVRAQLMDGPGYYLPNVPYVMYFGNSQIPWGRGYSFHGTYWHNDFGRPKSHGCVNMKTPEAEFLYNWAPEGTPVKIYGRYGG